MFNCKKSIFFGNFLKFFRNEKTAYEHLETQDVHAQRLKFKIILMQNEERRQQLLNG